MEMNFYNHVNKCVFKSALICGQDGTFETQPIQSEICLGEIKIIVNHDGLNTWCSDNSTFEPRSTDSLVYPALRKTDTFSKVPLIKACSYYHYTKYSDPTSCSS